MTVRTCTVRTVRLVGPNTNLRGTLQVDKASRTGNVQGMPDGQRQIAGWGVQLIGLLVMLKLIA
jgi:hypothetical protein